MTSPKRKRAGRGGKIADKMVRHDGSSRQVPGERKVKKSPDDVCRCGQVRSAVVHCKECCGWGVTEGIKAHEFRRASRKGKGKP